MAGKFREMVDNAKKVKEAYDKAKTIPEYEREAAARKAEEEYTKADGPLVKKAKGGSCKAKKYARGGGCELRGKTKGRMV